MEKTFPFSFLFQFRFRPFSRFQNRFLIPTGFRPSLPRKFHMLMQVLFLSLFVLLSAVELSAQAPPVDSLKKVMAAAKEDTVKVMTLAKLSFYNMSFKDGLEQAQQGLELAKKIKFEKGEAACLMQMANQYFGISDEAAALHYYLEALKISEHINDRNNMAYAYENIGLIFESQGDYEKALSNFKTADSLYTNDNYRMAILHANYGGVNELMDNQIEALKHYQRSYEFFNLCNDKYQLNLTLNGLGSVQLKLGNTELALSYFREAVKNGMIYNDTFGLSYTYLRIAELFDAGRQRDSSIYYAELSMFFAQRAKVLLNVAEAGKLLSALYEGRNDKESLRCLQISLAANDSLFSREKRMQIQSLLVSEADRQYDIAEKEKKDSEERRIIIQYAFIAASILIFIILFFLLSRSIITSTKLIKLLGVMALLIIFEFINLVLHPILHEITDHTPSLMLVALVGIAAFLVPLHHRVEKWVTEKLVEKNKQIRLAKAKKTIERLGEK
jgi:tetratricopeptide (TPR) repeat protein